MEREIIKKLAAATKCSLALDIPYQYGRIVLEENGFDHENRFEVSATDFVKNLQEEALEAAKEYC